MPCRGDGDVASVALFCALLAYRVEDRQCRHGPSLDPIFHLFFPFDSPLLGLYDPNILSQ